MLAAATAGVAAELEAHIFRTVEDDPDTALMCAISIVQMASESVTDEALAGPFEALLAKRGTDYVDVVCELSRQLPRLSRSLAYVWGQHIPKAVMRKIELFRTA